MCGKKSAGGQQIRERVKIGEEKLSMVLLFKIMTEDLKKTLPTIAIASAAGKTDALERIDEIDDALFPKLPAKRPFKKTTLPNLNSYDEVL